MQLVGMGLIIMSVLVISFGNQKPQYEETLQINELYFSLAVMSGLFTGVMCTVNMISLQIILGKYRLPPL